MHHGTQKDRRHELVLLDETNPRSVINAVSDQFAKRLRAIATGENSYLLGLTERKLRNHLFQKGKAPTPMDDRIRFAFWIEWDRYNAQDRKDDFNMSSVLGRNISKEAFYKHYITDDCQLAWLLCPPTKYMELLDEALRVSTEKLIELVSAIDAEKCELKEREFVLRVSRELAERTGAVGKKPIPVKLTKLTDGEAQDQGPEAPPEDYEAKVRAELAQIENLSAKVDEREQKASGGLVAGQ